MGKASNGNGKPKSGKPKSDHAARKYETRVVGIDAVAPHPRNTAYHAHPDAQIEMLAQSAQTFGQYKNIVVWKKQIIAGAGIWAGLKKAGATEIEIKDVSHLTQAQAFALMTADNETQKGAVTNDAELAALVREVMEAEGEALARLAAGEQKALDALLAQGNAVEETADVGELIDRAAELQKKWKVTRGDIFEVESKTARGKCHRIMCGDSTSKEDVEHIAAKEIRLEWSDPPYEMDTQGGGVMKQSGHLQKITDAGIDHFDPHLLYLVARTSVFCCNKPLLKKYIALADDWKMAWDLGFWKKNNTPPNYGGHLMTDVEYLFVVGEQSPNKGQDKSLYSKAFISDIVTDRIVGWQKPVELVCKFIYLFSTFGEIIFDRFLGSGTTLIACEQTGRIGRGMELEPKYVSVALERLQQLGLEPRRVTETEKRNGKQKRA